MKIFKSALELKESQKKIKLSGGKIGFVPTMGALHAGHISLVEMSKNHCEITICSIFVNPTQFNDLKDFENYPATLESDILKLEMAGCDILFLPGAKEIYPMGTTLQQKYDLGELENILEGKYRPGHFQGVCQIVHLLLNIVSPDFLFIGQKDYQQCMVIKKLLEILKLETKIIIGPTYRELSGLAFSSRNQRLTTAQKEDAKAIFEMLSFIKKNINTTPPNELIDYSIKYLLSKGFENVDYVSIANADNLEPVSAIDSTKKVALFAGKIGAVRLIDNMILE